MSMRANFFVSLLVAGLLAGCANVKPMVEAVAAAKTETEAELSQLTQMRKTGAVIRKAEAKLAGDEVQVGEVVRLPAVFHGKFDYLTVPKSLTDILHDINRRTGLQASVQPQQQTPGSLGMTPNTGVGVNVATNPNAMHAVEWKGDLKGLLDHLAARTQMFWKYEEGRIFLFRTETRTFHVHLPLGQKDIKSTISLSGVSGGSSSTGSSSGTSAAVGSVSVDSKMKVDAYADLAQSVSSILISDNRAGVAPPGGVTAGPTGVSTGGGVGISPNVTVNPSLGLVTVTADPIALGRVEQFIRSLNDRFAQNVLVGVKVYNVTLSRGANAGFSIKTVYENLVNKYKVSVAGTPSLTPSSGTVGTLTLDILPGSRFTGSQLVLQSLEKIGDVSLRTSGTVIAANGQPTPLQIANDITYLASSQTTTTANVGTTSSLTPGTKTVGFTGNFLPLILGDNRILLQYQIDLSAMQSLTQVTSNGSMIQTPNISKQVLQQQAYVKDGQSIVLFGFEQERAGVDAATGLTGSSTNAESSRTMMVIVMEVFGGK